MHCSEQYHIYLFERILLCCKEVNPNKQKEKLLGPSKKDKKEKEKRERRAQGVKPAKLQLKGRIFMTNVTTVVAICKTGES
jgi:cell division control protein 24